MENSKYSHVYMYNMKEIGMGWDVFGELIGMYIFKNVLTE